MDERTIKLQFLGLLLLVSIAIPYLLNRPILHYWGYLLLGDRGEGEVLVIKQIERPSPPIEYRLAISLRLKNGERERIVTRMAHEEGMVPKVGEVVELFYYGGQGHGKISVLELGYHYPKPKISWISIIGSLIIWAMLIFLFVTRESGGRFKDHYCQLN